MVYSLALLHLQRYSIKFLQLFHRETRSRSTETQAASLTQICERIAPAFSESIDHMTRNIAIMLTNLSFIRCMDRNDIYTM